MAPLLLLSLCYTIRLVLSLICAIDAMVLTDLWSLPSQWSQAERLAREGTKASVDLDQVRADSQLMELMDESVYDD